MDNFDFLKDKNKNLYKIIVDAENLFRDEYYEQSVVQCRRFAENLCTDVLKDKIEPNATFDFMINKIKDNMSDNVRIKEFVDDLYFIKHNGNISAHSNNTTKKGEIALECLERSFEISVFYAHNKFGYDEVLDKLLFSEELLMTGKKSRQKKLKEQYVQELTNVRNESKKNNQKKQSKNKCLNRKNDAKYSDNTTLKVFFVAAILTLITSFMFFCVVLSIVTK